MFHVKDASKMAPTTAAERQRKYRERLKADPERRERYLQSERERWRKNVEAGKKKAINELSEREQRKKRKMWRAAYHRSKERKEVLKNLSTPPQSPDQGDHPEQPSQPRSSRLGQWVVNSVIVKMSFYVIFHNVILETGRAGGKRHNFPHPNQLLLFCFVGNVWWLGKSTEEKKISSRGK